jgi:hypothetical protein
MKNEKTESLLGNSAGESRDGSAPVAATSNSWGCDNFTEGESHGPCGICAGCMIRNGAEDWSRQRYANEPFHPRVRGRCPSCGSESLFLGAQGYVTCGVIGCKDPGAVHDSLSKPEREQCICAAIKLPNGEVWRGHRHNDAIVTAGNAGATRDEIAEAVQGFITSRNRFVGRIEAARIQALAGIVSPDTGWVPRPDRELFSEDLYLRDWRDEALGSEVSTGCSPKADTDALSSLAPASALVAPRKEKETKDE